MTNQPTNVFLTGATGYIGGSVLTTLLKYPNKYSVTVLLRSESQVPTFTKLGVSSIIGDLDSLEILEKAAKESDAVIHTANCDHLPSAQALIKGLKSKNDPRAVYLQTSGTGELTYSSEPTDVPFDDEDTDRIQNIPIEALHRDVDYWIQNNVDGIVSATIAPSLINGLGSGPLKRLSAQVPLLAQESIKRGNAFWSGKFEARWGNININDLVELYRIVLDGLISNTIPQGFYFGVNQEHNWRTVAEQLGQVLHKHGLIQSPDVVFVETAELKGIEEYIWARDSRSVSTKGRKIGWNPIHPNVSETLEQEIIFMKNNGEFQA